MDVCAAAAAQVQASKQASKQAQFRNNMAARSASKRWPERTRRHSDCVRDFHTPPPPPPPFFTMVRATPQPLPPPPVFAMWSPPPPLESAASGFAAAAAEAAAAEAAAAACGFMAAGADCMAAVGEGRWAMLQHLSLQCLLQQASICSIVGCCSTPTTNICAWSAQCHAT